ncbi:MAG: methylmalonyl-CoA mutase, partial [Proteobacteria bacterium]|nr:methylmalonyl-CoA mutase [Pseudomonadota bacterium]
MWDKTKLKELERLVREWEETCLEPTLSQKPERRETFQTDVGLEIKRLYTPLDLSARDFDYAEDLGFPGQYP